MSPSICLQRVFLIFPLKVPKRFLWVLCEEIDEMWFWGFTTHLNDASLIPDTAHKVIRSDSTEQLLSNTPQPSYNSLAFQHLFLEINTYWELSHGYFLYGCVIFSFSKFSRVKLCNPIRWYPVPTSQCYPQPSNLPQIINSNFVVLNMFYFINWRAAFLLVVLLITQ